MAKYKGKKNLTNLNSKNINQVGATTHESARNNSLKLTTKDVESVLNDKIRQPSPKVVNTKADHSYQGKKSHYQQQNQPLQINVDETMVDLGKKSNDKAARKKALNEQPKAFAKGLVSSKNI